MVIKVINSKESLENLILVIDSKRLSNVIKKSRAHQGLPVGFLLLWYSV